MKASGFILPGYNVRPIEMMGAIGIEQLKKLPDFLKYRRKNAEYFQNFLKMTLVLLFKEKLKHQAGLVFLYN